MDWYRIRHTVGMYLQKTAVKRAEYIKKHGIFYRMGDNCMTMFRKIPLYPKLISFGNNVWVASGVTFVTHDVIHRMLNNKMNSKNFRENVGCIEVLDNCFIGANATILPNVRIGPDAVVGAGSLVTKSIPSGVYAGVPARYICSLEELMEKRLDSQVEMQGVTDALIEDCWKRFQKK